MKVERLDVTGMGDMVVKAEDFDRVEAERDALQALLNERDEKLVAAECLLSKYVAHVVQCEGADFIDQANMYAGSDVRFSGDELARLQVLSS